MIVFPNEEKYMKCTQILEQEHSIILEVLLKMEQSLIEPFKISNNEYQLFFEFIKEYADEFHHKKEEELYFKWIIKKNPGLEFGPIACMLKEHEEGRGYINSAEEALKTDNVELVKTSIKSFIELLRAHIDKENTVLYKMADSINEQTQDGDLELMPEFERVNKTLSKTPVKFGVKDPLNKEESTSCCGHCS